MATTYVAQPYAAIWDPDSTNLTLVQNGKITIDLEWEYIEVKDNDHGTMPVDMISNGIKVCRVRVPVTDHAFATLSAMMPMATYTAGGNGRIEARPALGTSLLGKAKELVLKRFESGAASTDPADWVTFPKAAPTGKFTISYGAEQSTYEVEFIGFPDTSNSNRCMYFGDETAS
jgi:hypothetical protein